VNEFLTSGYACMHVSTCWSVQHPKLTTRIKSQSYDLKLGRQRCKNLQRNYYHGAFLEWKLFFSYFKTLWPTYIIQPWRSGWLKRRRIGSWTALPNEDIIFLWIAHQTSGRKIFEIVLAEKNYGYPNSLMVASDPEAGFYKMITTCGWSLVPWRDLKPRQNIWV
jgi:hypothetical protein